MSAHECPRCGRPHPHPRALSIHLAVTHGERSAHPKMLANRGERAAVARLRAAARMAEPLPARPRDPVALLETVIALAHHDALLGVDAAATWLADLRRSIRRQGR